MARALSDPGGVPFHSYSSHAHVRDYVEWATSGMNFRPIDYPVYQTVRQWCQDPDKLKVVSEVIADRLELPSPASDKAVVLAQAIPVKALAPLLNGLKAQKERNHPFISSIAAHMHEAGEKAKSEVEAQAKKEDAQAKWDLWSALYGKSAVDWHPLPKHEDMGWGYWAAQEVGAEEWWLVAPKDEKEDKK